jgi:hypothetical protein
LFVCKLFVLPTRTLALLLLVSPVHSTPRTVDGVEQVVSQSVVQTEMFGLKVKSAVAGLAVVLVLAEWSVELFGFKVQHHQVVYTIILYAVIIQVKTG